MQPPYNMRKIKIEGGLFSYDKVSISDSKLIVIYASKRRSRSCKCVATRRNTAKDDPRLIVLSTACRCGTCRGHHRRRASGERHDRFNGFCRYSCSTLYTRLG